MTRAPARRHRRLLVLAGAALAWERLWPRLWPLAAVIGLFVSLALLDVLPDLPGWLHLAILAAFVAAALAALAYAASGVHLPDRRACQRRIERDSGLAHRPLAAMDDRLAAGVEDEQARSLWALHRQRMADTAARLAVKPPSPGVARLEPWGVRAGVVLLLVIALAAGGGSATERLHRASAPAWAASPRQPLSVEVWITPPAYTRVAPIFLSNRAHRTDIAGDDDGDGGIAAREPIAVPTGSAILAQVSGVNGPPDLVAGERASAFAVLAGKPGAPTTAYRAETTIDAGERLAVRAGRRTVAAWPLRMVADNPPSIAFANPPRTSGNGAFELAYTAADDYGVTAAGAVIRKIAGVDKAGDKDGDEPGTQPGDEANADEAIQFDLQLTGTETGGGLAAGTMTKDLSEHPWAGSPVRIRLRAEDALGQTGLSGEAEIILPERSFEHPVARAIIAERKRLEAGAPRPLLNDVAATLDAIAARPETYSDQAVVALTLSVAAARLRYDAGAQANNSVRALLWATALRLDEGDAPRAERTLAEARAKLMDALDANANEREIERLADELEQALAQYLGAVAAELARRGDLQAPAFPQDMIMGSDELRDMVAMAREMARTGARDGAREMLSRLQAMLDGIRGGLESRANREDLAEAGALMKELRELTDRQQDLLDRTFARMRTDREQKSVAKPKTPAPNAEMKNAAGEQRELRRRLGELGLRLDAFSGEIPPSLGAADRAMNSAARSLDAGRANAALDGQGEAVQALRDTLESAGRAVAQRLGAGMALFAGGSRGGGDIFGRTPGEQGHGLGKGDVKIPDHGEMRRAGEILQELRRRAGERKRPSAELDYIERLLRRF